MLRNAIYKIFSKIPITNELVKQIEIRMSIIYPENRDKVIRTTVLEIVKIIVINIIVFLALVIYGKVDIFYIFMCFIVMYILSKSIMYSKFDNLDIKLLKQFEKFLQEVRFQFKYDGMIDEALQEALQNADYEMYLQGNMILESLNEKDNNNYIETAPNNFFLNFYALCETVKKYGDKVKDEKSLFVSNLSYLKDDINIEILKREKINALFMGLTGVVVMPVFAIKPICIWGINSIPKLSDYYNGIAGKLSFVAITLVTFFVFNVIIKMKYPIEFDNHKSDWIKDILNIKWIDTLLMKIISSNYKKYYEMDRFLKSIVYKYNIKEFTVYRIITSFATLIISSVLVAGLKIYKLGIIGIVFSVVLIMGVTVCGYYYEIVMLNIRKRLLRINREEEVVRFQSVILILMYMDRMSVETILGWMENFAVVFKNVIEKISDTLIYRGIQVFAEAKDEVQFLPFERLMDCFIASDRIGIAVAFSDIASDRIYYIEKHKQENEIIINNKATIAKFIAFIPICLVICFVLVVPFIYEGLQQLQSFSLL